MRKSIFVFVLFYCYLAVAFAQASAFQFKQLTEEHGLPGVTVRSLFQDSKNILWVGVESTGLCRYDGYNFTVFESKQSDTTSLSNNVVEAIAEDSSGDIWVGTQDGLCKYDRQANIFKTYKHNKENKHSIPSNIVYDVLKTKQNTLFVATGAGLTMLNNDGESFNTIQLDKSNKPHICYDLFEASNGNVWLGTSDGLFLLNKQGSVLKYWNSNTNSELSGTVYSITEDASHSIWLGCDFQVLKLSQTKNTFESIAFMPTTHSNTGSYIVKLLIDREQNLWIGTAGEGLSILNLKTMQYQYLTPSLATVNGLKGLSIRDILEDCSGNIWLGLKFAGIQIFNPRQQLFPYIGIDFNANDVLASKAIISIFEDSTQNIWLGTGKYGLRRFDKTSKKNFAASNQNSIINSTRINDICQGNNNELWLASSSGVIRYSTLNQQNKNWPIGNVVTVCYDHSKTIWAGTTEGLYYKSNNNSDFKLYENENIQYKHNVSIKALFEDSKQNLWIGTLQNGLYLLDKRRSGLHYFDHNSDEQSISSNLIRYIFEDRKHRVWISTRGQGLNLFNAQNLSFTHYTEQDGLPSNTLFGIVEDKIGNIWLSSYKGIARFNPDNKSIDCYTKEFGLQHDMFEPQATCISQSGEIFMGGENGFNYFNPQNIKKQKLTMPLIITAVKIENKTIKTDIADSTTIKLSWNQNYITFDFSLLDYVTRQGIRYEYKLEGFDKQTQRIENRHSATYTNLEPGTYIFKLQGFAKDNTQNSNTVSVKITIVPPFWKTIWFRILFIIVLALTIYLYFRFKLRNVNKRNEQLEVMVRERTLFLELQKKELSLQKEKYQQQSEQLSQSNRQLQQSNNTKDTLFSVISHDLKNPFNVIMQFSENLLTKYYSIDDQKKVQYIGHIQTASKSVYTLLENLLNWYRLQSGALQCNRQRIDLHETISFVINEYALVALDKQITLANKVPKSLFVESDNDMLSTVIRNFVNNALKFTPKLGEVSIKTQVFEDCLEISVSDTGVGMSESELESLFIFSSKIEKNQKAGTGTGLGLKICKELIDLLQGVLDVKSKEGEGSTFAIRIPYKITEKFEAEISQEDALFNSWFNDLHQVDTIIEADKKMLLNKRILLVDDNPAILDYLEGMLSEMYRVSVASNGEQALELAQRDLPDLILSDLMMPELNGLELTKLLKSNKNTAHIPIILLTAQTADNVALTAYNAGVADFINKPFNDRILRLKIHNVLLLKESMRVRSGIEATVASIPNSVSIDDVFMPKLFETIKKNIENQGFDVEKLASEMGMSKSTLLRKLHQFTDKSPWELIVEIRFEKAKELLRTGKYSVSEVAWAIGFSDVKYFSRKFKEMYGIVPKDLMKGDVQ